MASLAMTSLWPPDAAWMGWRRAPYGMLLMLMLMLPLTALAGTQALPALSPEEQAWIRAHPVITFVAETRLPPLEDDENGKYTGLFSAYLDHVTDVSGLRFRYVPSDSWNDAQDRFMRGEARMFANAAADSLRPDVFAQTLRSRPYFASPLVLIGRADGPMVFGPADLRGKVIAVRARALQDGRIARHYPGARILPVDSADAGLKAVADGRADLMGGTAAMYFPRLRRSYVGTLGVAGSTGAPPYMARMAVHRDDPLLLSILDKSLATMTAEQTDLLEQKWLGMTADYGEPSFRSILMYRPLQVVLSLAIVLLLAATTGWALHSRRRARRSEQDKARFLAMMSHEIRTPINAMVGAVELLQHTPLDTRQRDLADTATLSAEALVDLLDNVLDLSRMDARRLSLERLPTDLHALMLGCVRLARVRAERKGLSVQLVMVEGPGPWLLLDATRLRQVMSNLLANAVKFTETGGITVSVIVAPRDGGDPAQVEVVATVTDTGIGIAPEHQEALFRPYRQADQTTTRRYGGTGLGLAICRELVTLMGGSIGLRSTPGTGTEVAFRLPAQRTQAGVAEPQGNRAPQAAAATNAMSSVALGHVLVVEDHPSNQKLIREQLSTLGVTVGIAGSGQQALAQLQQERFDLVLLDCHMPDMDGYETARRIRGGEAGLATIPIIAISAATDANHLQQCEESGMDGILRKPLRMADLSGVLDLWGVRHRAPGADLPAASAGSDVSMAGLMRADMQALTDALRSDRPDQARNWAHRMHGAARMAGLDDLADVAEVVEAGLIAGERPADALLLRLQQRVDALHQA